MAIPLIVGAAVAGVGAIAKGVKARKQRKEAAKIKDVRPEYKRPEEVDQNRAMYQNLAQSSEVPGQRQIESQLDQQQAGAMRAVDTGGGSAVNRLAAISGINRQRGAQQMQLGGQAAQYKTSMMDKLAQARSQVAQYKDVEFDYNKNQEFQYNRRRKNMLKHAADQNAMGAWSSLGNIGTSMMTAGMSGGGGGGQATSGYGGQSAGKYANSSQSAFDYQMAHEGGH